MTNLGPSHVFLLPRAMNSLKLKIPKPNTEQSSKESSSKPLKRRQLSDDEASNYNTSPSSSDREGASLKIRDVKTRDTPTLSRRPSKKRRVLSDDDYEDDRDLSPPAEGKPNLTKTKRDGKGKVKASTSTSTSTTTTVKLAKNERQHASKTDDINIERTVVTREEQEKAEKNAFEVSAATTDIPQRKKLPTIKKKTKPPGVVPPTLASATPSAISSPSTKISIALASATGKETTPVTTLNPSGSGDFDLRDSNTWQSLLGKKTTNSGPRVGIEKRVSTQERRKQLDKMREDARMLRNEQLKDTFDLQAQSQQIMQYEKSLAHHEIQVLGPHILGAAFKNKPLAG